MPPFRFAVQVSTAPDAKAWRERARKIEDLGYSTMYVPDHFGDQWAPIVGMTIAAEATERLKVGALVWDNDYRHPVVLAKEVATLDLASDGRVEAGIGAGWMVTDYDESGIPYDRPGLRIDRLEESITVLKALWRDGTATFEGRHYSIRGAQGVPRPASVPHPTLVIGGGGKRMLSIAAREADVVGVNPNLKSGRIGPEVAAEAAPDKFRQKVAWVREAAGDRFDQLELQCLTFFSTLTPDRRALAEQLGPAFGVSPDDALRIPIVLSGTVDEICDQLVERREEYGISYWVLHDEFEDFAPVVARLAGT